LLVRPAVGPLTAARNIGLGLADAEVVAIPDDDCWYPPPLLGDVATLLAEHEDWDGISGRTIDERGHRSVVASGSRPGFVTSRNVWNRTSAPTLFLRRRLVEAVGFEDETLGPGAGTPWGAADETDYVLRAIELGLRIRYEPVLTVYHLHPNPELGRRSRAKAYSYGRGSGYVLRRHGAPRWFALWRCALLAGESLRNLLLLRPARAVYYAAMCAGRVRGWLFDRPGEPRYPPTPGAKATIADSQART
jgi:hypothetical protein